MADGVTLAVVVSGGLAGQPPYSLSGTANVVDVADHCLRRGCQVRELPRRPSAASSPSPEGHTPAVTDALAPADDDGATFSGASVE
jgi:hypothetical protein